MTRKEALDELQAESERLGLYGQQTKEPTAIAAITELSPEQDAEILAADIEREIADCWCRMFPDNTHNIGGTHAYWMRIVRALRSVKDLECK